MTEPGTGSKILFATADLTHEVPPDPSASLFDGPTKPRRKRATRTGSKPAQSGPPSIPRPVPVLINSPLPPPEIKPIETHYAGCRFRSRLEARWAVFFDHLDIQWHYELEGFELPDGTRYLPDFYLPQHNQWVEVKGSIQLADLRTLAQATIGLHGASRGRLSVGKGVLILGPIPQPCPYITHTRFMSFGGLVLVQHAFFAPVLPDRIVVRSLNEPYVIDVETFDWSDDDRSSASAICASTLTPDLDYDICLHPPIVGAYTAARSARFEHGESG